VQFQVRALERAHAAEGLADVGQRQDGRRHGWARQKILANSATLLAS
jgi:hypothetical protein